MGDATKALAGAMAEGLQDQGGKFVELPLDRFERLLVAIERLAQGQERKLAQENDNARRAAKKVGPTTEEAEARVERRLRRIRGR